MEQFPLPARVEFSSLGLGTVQSDKKTVRELLLLFLMMHVSNRNWCLSHLMELPFTVEKNSSSCTDLFCLPCRKSKSKE